MTCELSFAVQHHPSRAELIGPLVAAMGGDVDVVTDPEPDGFKSPWRTYRRALETTPAGATHRVIVQDDATPCAGFRPAVEALVAAQPDRLITLFVAGSPREYRDAVYAAARRDSPWAELGNSRWTPTIGLCWPVRMIRPLLEFVDAQGWPPTFRADDEIVGRFMKHSREGLLATVPSLLEHEDVVVSTIGLRAWAGQDLGRVAACWIGDCDPACIDWTQPP